MLEAVIPRRPLTLAAVLVFGSLAFAGWQEEERLTERPGAAHYTSQNNARCIASDNVGNIHVVWYADSGQFRQIWYTFRDAMTGEWSNDTAISSEPQGAVNPALAVDDSGNAHVVWQLSSALGGDSVLRYRRRDEDGSWRSPELIRKGNHARRPSIACIDSDTVVVAWQEDRPSTRTNVYTALRTTGVWSQPEAVSDTSSGYAFSASVGVDAHGRAHVLWSASSDNRKVLYRLRDESGWLSTDTLYQGVPGDSTCLWAEEDGTAHALWSAMTSSGDRLMYNQRAAVAWRDSTVLPAPYPISGSGSVACDDRGGVHAAWSSRPSGPARIYYSHSDSAGREWSEPLPFDSAAYDRRGVSLSAGPRENLQIVWMDNRNGPQNYDIYCRRYVFGQDVGVMRIESPVGSVDSGAPVFRAAWLRNTGDTIVRNLQVWFRISSLLDSTVLDSLGQNDSARVTFDSMTIAGRGWCATACSTALSGDINHSNDVFRDSVFVRVRDVALYSILCPQGRIQRGTVQPSVQVGNNGNAAATCSTSFEIKKGAAHYYGDTVTILLAPGADSAVGFADWPGDTGSYTGYCRTWCAGDMHPENDTGSVQFEIYQPVVIVDSLIRPGAVVDSGDTVLPQVRIINLGPEPESFSCLLTVGARYADTMSIESLPANDTLDLEFDKEWNALERGHLAVLCTIPETGSSLSRTTFVRVCDAAAAEILWPSDTVGRGPHAPRARFRNLGNELETLRCWFGICDTKQVYFDSSLVILGPESDSVVDFDTTYMAYGSYASWCSVAVSGDRHPENDTCRSSFTVVRIDAVLDQIVAPVGTIRPGPVTPRVRTSNLGDRPADIKLRISISDSLPVYVDSVTLAAVPAHTEVTATFGTWAAAQGRYSCFASAFLPDDEDPANDTASARVVVESLSGSGWRQLASMPIGPRGAPARDGAALVALNGGLLALKGCGTSEWYRYDIGADNWSALAAVPLGPSGRKVKAGAAACTDGAGRVFVVKGNRTRELLEYSVSEDSWSFLPNIPAGTHPLRYSAGLAYVATDTGHLYLVKASGTNDFLVHWLSLDQWHARRPVPGKKLRHGTALVTMGKRVFCLKGGTNELAEYFAKGDSWSARSPMPRQSASGRTRKARKGACLAGDGSRYIYAFKGGWTCEFWRYDVVADTWVQLEDIPMGDCHRKVGRGGTLALLNSSLYALKAGGCLELWCYEPPAGTAGPKRLAVTGGQDAARTGLVETRGTVVILDVLGRRVKSSDRRRPGVYFALDPATGRTVKSVVVR